MSPWLLQGLLAVRSLRPQRDPDLPFHSMRILTCLGGTLIFDIPTQEGYGSCP
jgi:hypothetical protein